MIDDIYRNAEARMEKAIVVLKRELGTVRAGRASPSLLDKVVVDYYGTLTPLNQLATITAPEPRLLVIQPWDKNAISACERGILKSDLGLTPSSDGTVIRLVIPPLTEERRAKLTKVVRKMAEETKVAVRNIRREANEKLKALQKEGNISQDEERRAQQKIQKLTDSYIQKVDQILAAKEAEIMEV